MSTKWIIKRFCVSLVVLTLARGGLAQDGYLSLYVVDLQNKPIRNVRLSIFGLVAEESDDKGNVLINLPSNIRPGEWVQLSVHPASLVLISPWDGRLHVPLNQKRGAAIKVIVEQKGNKGLLESPLALESIASKTLRQIVAKSDTRKLEIEERRAVLSDVADEYGLTVDEIGRAIRERGLAEGQYFRSLFALYQNNFSEAAEYLKGSYESLALELDVTRNKLIDSYIEKGKALLDMGKFADAEEASRAALTLSPANVFAIELLGRALSRSGKYGEAELNFARARSLAEKMYGGEHLITISILDNLSSLYIQQGKYEEAEILLNKVVGIRGKLLGSSHPAFALSLDRLGTLRVKQGRYAEAAALYLRALSIREDGLGIDSIEAALSANSIANLYRYQGKYAKSEELYQRALDISEKLPRKEHPDTAVSIDGLAGLYEARGLYAESERLYQCALSIREKSLGKEHPDTSGTLDSVARLHKKLSEQLIGKEGQIQLSALPAIIKAGQSTELIWSSKNADKAFLSCAGKVATEGTFTVTPNSTMDYILVVEGKLGIVSRTVNVQVTDAGSGDYPLTDYYFGSPVIDVYKNNSFIDLLDRIRHALLDKMSLSVSGPFPLSSGHYRFITGFTQRGDLVQLDERTIVRRISYLVDVGKNNNTGSEYKLTIRTSVMYRKLVEKTWRTEKNRDIMLAAAFRLKDVIGRAQK